MGIGFYNSPLWIIYLLTTLVVAGRFFLIPDPSRNIVTFITYLVTYLLIAMISVGLMKNVQKVKEENRQLTKVLANALVSRDPYTLHHSENAAKYSLELAEEMNLSKDICDSIRTGTLLHDIGKIGIPENILNKDDKLTDQEYKIIKDHPQIGYKIIEDVSIFNENGVSDIVLYHHERYDGKGYPEGLKEDEIPLTPRIVAVADAFDAMSSKRSYREELDHDYILNEISKGKGTQFNPKIVDIFLKNFAQRNTHQKER
ncbi:HD-GYP domain-containing protein [Bacillus suaedaesalsae]|uniref:HD-GYP domain-containing protein n=1 Tax=Bacillus suaedaesalsae TaxID=2810349 RepID=UPI001EF5B057|nr:HD-GYP domain-containing protein [Bacillus suaedaesalsae]